MKYDHKKIEAKWQQYWLANKTFKAEVDYSKPKYYALDMFPYPSGSGLHVGHPEGFTATDIIARYKRQRGFNVLHPMGWDSFGLPAEQYAVRTGTHPSITTKTNIDTFRRQLRSLGFSYDWDREVATSDPSYYKWTQWIFTLLYERGLAYEAEMYVNYCPALGTVLANEEVDNGRAKEGGHPVERRPLKQWVLKITAYAERLIADLDLLDWPESLKKLQTNWIGRSEGAEISFAIQGVSGEKINAFTTRPDTLFGVACMVLAPEHPLVDKVTTPDCSSAVDRYRQQAANKSDLARTDLNKEKSGVFTGGYALNPINGQPVPIWIADYVLISYGTGAIMSVPAHDERDFAFAKQFGLPILPLFDPDLSDSSEQPLEGMNAEEFRQQILGGKCCWTKGGTYINCHSDVLTLNGYSNIPAAKKAVTDWLEKAQCGKAQVTYKLRDWLFARQRYWGEPFPILHFADGSMRPLGIDELPLCPPEVADFKPCGDGNSPLARVKEWVEIFDPVTGQPARRESNTMPQWAGSCWYYLRFCDPHNEQAAWSQEAEKYWMPVDLYIGGVEHAVLHLLYARFWHKVLFDCGLVTTLEPFQTLRNQGMILSRSYQRSNNAYVEPADVLEKNGVYSDRQTGEQLHSQIEKMSKSRLNGVTPDEIVEEFGADSLRLYEMFMGPLDREKVWNTDAVSGCRRFLSRLYDLAVSDKLSNESNVEALRLGHRLLHAVTQDIEALQFNTAIAKMMEFINDFSKLDSYPRSVVALVAQIVMPFAPHLAEEMWQLLNQKGELSYTPYPPVEEQYLHDDTATYVVQVNGKVRGKFELPKDQSQEVILKAAEAHPHVAKYLAGMSIEKVIFVPNKLLNVVAK
jgi:leucyl-tRNA synthetase